MSKMFAWVSACVLFGLARSLSLRVCCSCNDSANSMTAGSGSGAVLGPRNGFLATSLWTPSLVTLHGEIGREFAVLMVVIYGERSRVVPAAATGFAATAATKWILPEFEESRLEPFRCFQFILAAAMPDAAVAAIGGGTTSCFPGTLDTETVFPARVDGKLKFLCFYGMGKGKNKGNVKEDMYTLRCSAVLRFPQASTAESCDAAALML